MKRLSILLLALLMLWGCSPGEQGTQPSGEEILAQRRAAVVAYMRQMLTVKWTTDEDIVYSIETPSQGPEEDESKYRITLHAGRIYQGIPYTHGGGSGYSFLVFDADGQPDENGVYRLSGLNGHAMTGLPSSYLASERNEPAWNVSRLGNDCSDSLFWAWSQVSASISFQSTRFMTETYGCVYLGDYDMFGWDNYANSGAFPHDSQGTTAANICQKNGIEKMFAAYALLQEGDGLVYRANTNDGHAVMVSGIHLSYLPDGSIDGENSYITTLDQTNTGERKQKPNAQGIYELEEMDKKRTFNELYNTGYLPMTCKELIDPAPVAAPTVNDGKAGTAFTLENIFTGFLSANRRIAYVTLTVTGPQQVELTCFNHQETMHAASCTDTFDLSRIQNPYEQNVLLGDPADLEKLSPGAYHGTLTCRLGSGETVTVREFDFAV